jgi:hypothetical protein
MNTDSNHQLINGSNEQTPEHCLKDILSRNRLTAPDGRILYKYQLSKQEYSLLKNSLKANRRQLESSLYFKYWAAAFCLYVSEWYRRDYDSSWSWIECERQLELSLTQLQHEKIVICGIRDFWKRKIHKRGSTGRDLLGTLFFEGGLPWPLIKQEGHSFGNIIKRCFGDYYQLGNRGYLIIDIVNKYRESLPQVFQNDDSLLLIAGIVDSLRHASEKFDLSGEISPYEFLMRTEPEWKANFPLLLDDDMAQELVNEWLIDAEKKKAVRTTQTRQEQFSCSHYHTGKLSDIILSTIIQYPNLYTIPINPHDIQSTRFEMILYEGTKPISHEGVAYGEIEQDHIKVRIQKKISKVRRRQPSTSLTMKFLSAGTIAYQKDIPESMVDTEGLMVFSFSEGVEDQYEYISNSSCSVPGDIAIIRVPIGSTIDPIDVSRIAEPSSDYLWNKISHDSTITIGDEQFFIRLSSAKPARGIFLSGRPVQLQTNPSVCYYGLPKASFDMVDIFREVSLYINKTPIPEHESNEYVGKNTITAVDIENHILFRKQIGIISKQFTFRVIPKIHNTLASIEFFGIDDIRVNIKAEGVRVTQEANRFQLQPNEGEDPHTLSVMMKGIRAQNSVEITLPYPKEGATLINDSHNPLCGPTLHIDKLLGLILLIHSLNQHEWVHLTLNLVSKCAGSTFKICYRYKCTDHVLQLSLFSLRSDILNLFSIVADQDAIVRLCVENDNARKLYSLDITRYEGDVVWDEIEFSIRDRATLKIMNGACPIAMNISDPKQKKEFTPKLTEDVETGFFRIDGSIQKDGPWLIMPDPQSTVLFRPRIYINRTSEITQHETTGLQNSHIESLHTAAKLFDGNDTENFSRIVSDMASDYDHGGWGYLKALVETCPHIPLSSFEVWLTIAKNYHSLAAAIFRLDLGESMCQKIQDELAILWDSIPINSWYHACRYYREFLSDKGLQDSTIRATIDHKSTILASVIPVFKEFASYICDKKLQHPCDEHIVIECLKGWGNHLRTDHIYQRYLEYLTNELLTWKHNHCQVKLIEIFSDFPSYIRPTVYLPFFMAELTYGISSLESLAIDEKEARFSIRRLIEFDRSWYISAHALILNYLINHTEEESR